MMEKRVPGLALVAAFMTLAGCASYRSAPLDRAPNLASHVSDLVGANNRPITLADLDRMVLGNNPELRAARAKLGVATAQVIEAELLPNPQIALSYPFYMAGPNGSDAFSVGVAQDLKSILLRPTRREIADNAASAINASLLWQEWQTLGKARLLFVDIVSGERAEKALQRSRKFLQERFDLTKAAIKQGNATLAALSPDLVAVGDVEKSYDDLERLQLNRRHQLNALLGLAPDAPLLLAGASETPRVDAQRIRADMASLPDRRPDLIALQYGYRSEDAKLRQAILSQFPNVAIGLVSGRDSSSIYSFGPEASFELPVFNRNEGAIALEQATREQLNREFNARLTAAEGEIGALLSEQSLLARQLAAIEPRLKEARLIAEKTEAAFKQGSFDERAYVDIEVAQLTREQEKIGLQQALLDGQVALATLIGAGMPRISIGPEPPPADVLGLFQATSR
ncbi:TolC family protein [Methylocella tundrae]|uniref:TolC family protein n=1 Tax=Methylocella tundrae TaxID=227605 RepID=UPI0030FE5F42